MTEPVHVIEKGNVCVEIWQDEEPPNPRTEHENVCLMFCWHRQYDLGDKHNLSQEEVQEMIDSGEYYSAPLYLLDHSGLSIRTSGFSCGWDSGQVGWILLNKDKYQEDFVKLNSTVSPENIIKAEVEEYDNYLRGNVYGYSIIKDGVEVDSCWGYFGDWHSSGILEDAGVPDGEIEKVIPPKLDIEKTLVVNLKHITPEDDYHLGNFCAYKTFEEPFNSRLVIDYGYGLIVRLDNEFKNHIESANEDFKLSEAFYKLYEFVKNHKEGFTYLKLEVGGSELEGFEIFDW